MSETITVGTRTFTVLFPDALRALTPEESSSLHDSILAHGGVVTPVICDEHDGLIDGINRVRMCAELGLNCIPVENIPGLTDAEKLELAYELNDARRHLTPGERKTVKERRAEIRTSLQTAPEKSNRQIADESGASDKTVAKVRDDLERRGEIPHVETRTDTKGREQPAKKANPLWCSRCNRMGVQAVDCKPCKEVREKAAKDKKAKKKKPAARGEMKDKVGNVLPDRCRDAFADTGLPTLIETLEQIEAMFRVEPWLDKAQKLTDHYGFILIGKFKEHSFNALESLQLAAEALRAGLPHAVCPKCNAVDSKGNGKCCTGCRGHGFVPETRYQELTRE